MHIIFDTVGMQAKRIKYSVLGAKRIKYSILGADKCDVF